MKQSVHWTGSRSVPINEFTNRELDDTIDRLVDKRDELIEQNDPILGNVVDLFNEVIAQLVAERAERIGK